ncbi:unnamed protein product [Closterium sp. Yama58-4]|nr:unnamed protein product [Closterium sp. Yama58-4]
MPPRLLFSMENVTSGGASDRAQQQIPPAAGSLATQSLSHVEQAGGFQFNCADAAGSIAGTGASGSPHTFLVPPSPTQSLLPRAHTMPPRLLVSKENVASGGASDGTEHGILPDAGSRLLLPMHCFSQAEQPGGYQFNSGVAAGSSAGTGAWAGAESGAGGAGSGAGGIGSGAGGIGSGAGGIGSGAGGAWSGAGGIGSGAGGIGSGAGGAGSGAGGIGSGAGGIGSGAGGAGSGAGGAGSGAGGAGSGAGGIGSGAGGAGSGAGGAETGPSRSARNLLPPLSPSQSPIPHTHAMPLHFLSTSGGASDSTPNQIFPAAGNRFLQPSLRFSQAEQPGASHLNRGDPVGSGAFESTQKSPGGSHVNRGDPVGGDARTGAWAGAGRGNCSGATGAGSGTGGAGSGAGGVRGGAGGAGSGAGGVRGGAGGAGSDAGGAGGCGGGTGVATSGSNCAGNGTGGAGSGAGGAGSGVGGAGGTGSGDGSVNRSEPHTASGTNGSPGPYTPEEQHTEERKRKRELSNCASSRRARQRQQDRLAQLEIDAANLKLDNASAHRRLTEANEQIQQFQVQKEESKQEVRRLRLELSSILPSDWRIREDGSVEEGEARALSEQDAARCQGVGSRGASSDPLPSRGVADSHSPASTPGALPDHLFIQPELAPGTSAFNSGVFDDTCM